MSARSDVAIRATEKVIDSRRLLYFYHVAKAGRFTAAEAVLDVPHVSSRGVSPRRRGHYRARCLPYPILGIDDFARHARERVGSGS